MTRYRCALVLLLTMAVIGCRRSAPGNRPGAEPTAAPIRIGLFTSLTGTTAAYGSFVRRGAEVAIDELNASGGQQGRRFELIVEDNGSKPEEAATAVTRLIARDGGVTALVGDFSSGRTLAAAPIAQRAGVPLVSPGATNPAVTAVGNCIFRTSFIDSFQGTMLARFTSESQRFRRVAILRDVRNDYSVDLARYFTTEFERLGGEVVATEAYAEGDADFKAQLTAIRATRPEALFVPAYVAELSGIAAQARELGLTVPLFGGDGWAAPELVPTAGRWLEGSFYIDQYSPHDTARAVRQLVETYRQRFHELPSSIDAIAYDAVKLVADAIGRAGSTEHDAVRRALAATKDFPGASGVITMNADRNPVKPVVLMRIFGGQAAYDRTLYP